MLDRSTSAITSVKNTRGLDANYLCEIFLLKDTVHQNWRKKVRLGNRIRADPIPEMHCFIQLVLLLNPRRCTSSTKMTIIE